MIFTVEKRIEFDVDEIARYMIEDLYSVLEYGSCEDEWKCLSLDQQEELVKAILEKAVEIKEGD